MTNYLNTSIFIVLFTQFILCEVKVVSEERFNSLLNDNTCKNIKYGKCYDFLNESISFRNHQKNNYLKSERIFITETPKKSNFKHMYEISKSGMVYYLPKYILETNSSKINSEHILSKGDDIIVYHLFNKVFFVEIINTHVEEIKPTYLEKTNNQPKIIEKTNNQQKKIDYSGPTRNTNGSYDIRLTNNDFEFVKKKLKLSGNYKDLSSFVKTLDELNSKTNCDFFLDIEHEKTNDGIILKNLFIDKFEGMQKKYLLNDLYKPGRVMHHKRKMKERTEGKDWPAKKRINYRKLWDILLSNTNNIKVLQILTFCINLDKIYPDIIKDRDKATLFFIRYDKIELNTKIKNSLVLKLFEGKGT